MVENFHVLLRDMKGAEHVIITKEGGPVLCCHFYCIWKHGASYQSPEEACEIQLNLEENQVSSPWWAGIGLDFYLKQVVLRDIMS